jgi:replicative DNA helicase
LRFVKKPFEYVRDNVSRVINAILNRKKYSKGKLFIKKYPVKGATTNTLKAYIKQLQNVKGITPDMVIIDYGALLRSTVGYKDKRDEFEAIYLDIRTIADEFDCAVWTGAQCNRTALSKKVVTMADLAECFAIANAADAMVALCQSVKEQKAQIMRYFIAKNRDNKDHMTLQGKDYRDRKVLTVDKFVTDDDENLGDDEDVVMDGSDNL